MGRPYFAEWVGMLDNASQFDEKSEAVAVNASYAQSVMVQWSRGANDGEIVIECADSKYFDGIWAELKRIPCTGENRLDLFEHNGACVFVRTRITRPISAGTVTTKLQCMVG
jgi:hypothetical protein